jgi:hypothetical protein
MNKAKIGDRIKSFNVSNMSEYGYFIGMVTWVDRDDKDGVEYVYYTALVENRNGADKNMWREMRVPQNGQKTWLDNTTNFIEIL